MVAFIMSNTRADDILSELKKIDEEKAAKEQLRTAQKMSAEAKKVIDDNYPAYYSVLQLWQNAKDYMSPDDRVTLAKANQLLDNLRLEDQQKKGLHVLDFLKERFAQVVVEEGVSFGLKVGAKASGTNLVVPSFVTSMGADLTGWVSGLVARSLVRSYIQNSNNPSVVSYLEKNADNVMKMVCEARQQQIQFLTDQMLSFIVYVGNRSGGLTSEEFFEIQQQFIKAIVAISYDMDNTSLTDDINRTFGIRVHSPTPFEFQQMMFGLFAEICDKAIQEAAPKPSAFNSLAGAITTLGKSAVAKMTFPFDAGQVASLKKVVELFNSHDEAKQHERSMQLTEDANLKPTKLYLKNLRDILEEKSIFLGTPEFWKDEYIKRTLRDQDFQAEYQQLTADLILRSEEQARELSNDPKKIITLLTNTKKYLATHPESFWLKDIFRSQFKELILKHEKDLQGIDLLTAKQDYIEFFGGAINDFSLGTDAYNAYLAKKETEEKARQTLLVNFNNVLLGDDNPSLPRDGLKEKANQTAAHFHSPNTDVSAEEIDTQLTMINGNVTRAKAQFSASAANSNAKETAIDYRIRGGLHFATQQLFFSLSQAMGAETKTLAETSPEFDVSTYKKIEHVVKTDLLERATKWVTRNYLTHETSLRTSWKDTAFTGTVKDFAASVTATVSSIIVGEIFYRCFPPGNLVNDELRNQVNNVEKMFFAKHREIIELISTEMLRVLVYIKTTPDVAKLNKELNAIVSQINQAIAVLSNKAMEDPGFKDLLERIFPGSAKSATALQLQETIYQLCSDLCVKSANAINDNPFSKKMAEEVKTSAQSVASVGKHVVAGVVETVSEAFTATSAIYLFNDVQRLQLQYLADNFDASRHVMFSQELYENSVRPDERFVKACRHLSYARTFSFVGFTRTQPLVGSPKAWLLDYRVRADLTQKSNAEYEASINKLMQVAHQQMNDIIKDPLSLILILQATKAFLDERPDDAAQLELLPKLRLQLLQLTIYIQEYLYVEKITDAKYREDAIRALGSVKRFYTDVLQGDVSDIVNARSLRANQAGVKKALTDLENRLSEEKQPLFLGSPALWLSSYPLRQTTPNMKFSGNNPPLHSGNVDQYINNTLEFFDKLSKDNPSLSALYRLLLIKQVAEYITPGTTTHYSNAYVRGALEARLLTKLFNGKIQYPVLDDIAQMENVSVDFNESLLQLMAYFPDQSDLFDLSWTEGYLENDKATEFHRAIDAACKQERAEYLKQAKERELHEKQLTAQAENKSQSIDPTPEYTRLQIVSAIYDELARQESNKVRADSLNTRRDLNSVRFGKIDTPRSHVMGVTNAFAQAAGAVVDAGFGFTNKQKPQLYKIDIEKEQSFFQKLSGTFKDWATGVAARKITNWTVQNAAGPVLQRVKNIFAPQTGTVGNIAVDTATQVTGWLAGIFAERLVLQLLAGKSDKLSDQQKIDIEENCVKLCENYRTTIQTIAEQFLVLLTYIKERPDGVDVDELNAILSQLNGAIATLCQNVALDHEIGLKDLFRELKGEDNRISPNELQKQIMLLCVKLCDNAHGAEAEGLVARALKPLQGEVAGNTAVSALDFLSELLTNQRLVTEFNSLQRSTLQTLSNKLTFQANTLDTRLGDELVNRLDQDYLDQLNSLTEQKLYGSPQSWIREYRRYFNPASSLRNAYHAAIMDLVKKSAEQSADLLIHPEKIIALLTAKAEQKNLPPNYTLQVREQLTQLVYGLEKNLTLLANGYTIHGINDPKDYANKAALALGHIKYQYVHRFKGDASDIDNALRLRFATPMLMDNLIKLQSILERNPECCRGAQSLWLSAQQQLDIPLPSHMMTAATLTPDNIKPWLDNTRHLLESLKTSDPQLAELYRLFVIKQICELATERFDSFLQFPAQDFLREMGIDYATTQAIATFSETQFDFNYSFEAMLAFLKDNVSLKTQTNIYSDPLIEASERVSSALETKRLMQLKRERQLADFKLEDTEWKRAKQSHERTKAVSEALYKHASMKKEEVDIRFAQAEMRNYIQTLPPMSFDALAAEAKKRKVETEIKTAAQPIEQKGEGFALFIELDNCLAAINRTLNHVTDTDKRTLPAFTLETEFKPGQWQGLKQFVISSAARDGSELVLQTSLNMGSPWIPPGASTLVKLGSGLVIHLTGLFIGKATELYLKPQNSLNKKEKLTIEQFKKAHLRKAESAITTITTEMLRLLKGVCEADPAFDKNKLDQFTKEFVKVIVTQVTDTLRADKGFFELLKLTKSETTTTLELTASILELCKELCVNADTAIKDNPIAQFFDIHQFSLANRQSLRVLSTTFDHIISDVRHQEQRLSLAHLKADENYNTALDTLRRKDLLLGDDNAWLADFSIRIAEDSDALKKIFDASAKQKQELIANPHLLGKLLDDTCRLLEDPQQAATLAHPVALQPKVRQQVLHIAHGIIQNLQAMANHGESEASPNELAKIQQYTRDAMSALSAIRQNYSRLGGDPSDFENVMQLSHGTHKEVLDQAFRTLQKIIDPTKILTGSGTLWLSALPDEKKLHDQTITNHNFEQYCKHTTDFIRELEDSKKPQLAQLYRLFVIKQLSELLTSNSLNEENLTKIARDILPGFGIKSYLAIYEIDSIGRIKFDLQDNLITLLALVSDQLDMQQLAAELNLDLSQQLGDPIDAMIRSALLVDTLRAKPVKNTTLAIDSTIATMDTLNKEMQLAFQKPAPTPPSLPTVRSINLTSLGANAQPLLDSFPKKRSRWAWLTDFGNAIGRFFKSCWPSKKSAVHPTPTVVEPPTTTPPAVTRSGSTQADLMRGSLGRGSVNRSSTSINTDEAVETKSQNTLKRKQKSAEEPLLSGDRLQPPPSIRTISKGTKGGR